MDVAQVLEIALRHDLQGKVQKVRPTSPEWPIHTSFDALMEGENV